MYCGATENEVALKDLKQALSLKPEDKLIRREYVKLKRELEKQHVKDSKQFGGLFDRGRVVEDAGNADMSSIHDESQSRMTVEEALQSLKDAESTCQVAVLFRLFNNTGGISIKPTAYNLLT